MFCFDRSESIAGSVYISGNMTEIYSRYLSLDRSICTFAYHLVRYGSRSFILRHRARH